MFFHHVLQYFGVGILHPAQLVGLGLNALQPRRKRLAHAIEYRTGNTYYVVAHDGLLGGNDVVGQIGFERGQTAAPEQVAILADLGEQGLLRRDGKHPVRFDAQGARGLPPLRLDGSLDFGRVLMSSHKVSILLSAATRPARASPRQPLIWFCHISRSLRVTPVSAASTNSTACALGNMFRVNSGSLPRALRPGVSRTTNPCWSRGGETDQRMAPLRDLHRGRRLAPPVHAGAQFLAVQAQLFRLLP